MTCRLGMHQHLARVGNWNNLNVDIEAAEVFVQPLTNESQQSVQMDEKGPVILSVRHLADPTTRNTPVLAR
jgi:hypothetical protein